MARNTTGGGASSPASPTTFVQADTNSFRGLVQKLTGLPGDTNKSLPARLSSPSVSPRRPSFKLQERRQTIKNLEIELALTSIDSQHIVKVSSQTHLPEFSAPSPVTPLSSEFLFFLRQDTDSPSFSSVSDEEKAIAEKGFCVHPSPMNTPRRRKRPELLTLFPLTSSCERD